MNKYYIEIDAGHPRDVGSDEQAEMLDAIVGTLRALGFTEAAAKFKPAPPGAGITEGVIYRTRMGLFSLGPNGIVFDSTEKDPVELRLGVPEGQIIAAKVSGDIIASNGHRTEVASFNLGCDGRYRHDPDRRKRLRGAIFFGGLDATRFPELATDHDWQWERQLAIAHDGLWVRGEVHLNEPGGPW